MGGSPWTNLYQHVVITGCGSRRLIGQAAQFADVSPGEPLV